MAQLEDAIGLSGLLASELRYTMSPMEGVLARLAQLRGILPFVPVCAKSCAGGVPFPQAWQQALRQSHTALNEDDLRVLYRLGTVLGAVDLDGALKELEYAEFVLKQRHQEAQERKKQLGGLYQTLGVLIGIGVVILLF